MLGLQKAPELSKWTKHSGDGKINGKIEHSIKFYFSPKGICWKIQTANEQSATKLEMTVFPLYVVSNSISL